MLSGYIQWQFNGTHATLCGKCFPGEQPSHLAMLLPHLLFPLVLWPCLSPAHAAAEPGSFLPTWAPFPGVPEHWVWAGSSLGGWCRWLSPRWTPHGHAPCWASYPNNHTLEEAAIVFHAESNMDGLGNRHSAKTLWTWRSCLACPPIEPFCKNPEMLLSFCHSWVGVLRTAFLSPGSEIPLQIP